MTVTAAARFLTFRAGGRLRTLPAGAVREVVKLPPTTRVPHAPASLVGLANVRGAAVPILRVAASPDEGDALRGRVLVLDRVPPLGLLVDGVQDIVATKGRARAVDVDELVDQVFRRAPAWPAATIARAAPAAPKTAEATVDILTFLSGGQDFALPLDQVIEVIVTPSAITALPEADAAVVGTIEHRGALLPILALSRLLGLEDPPSAARSRIVIATLKGHAVGLVVDAVQTILRVAEATIDPVPAIIARRASEARIQAIARIDGGRRLVSLLAADQLFDDALIAQLVARRDTATRSRADVAADATELFLIVRLGAQWFGMPAATVSEVASLPDTLAPLPRAPDFVAGVMNLRGRAIPVIDRRRRFGGATARDGRRRAIVVRIGGLRAAFVVDEVMAIRSIAKGAIAPAPAMSDDTRLFDRTATMADGGILLLIEAAELLDGAERDLLAALEAGAARVKP